MLFPQTEGVQEEQTTTKNKTTFLFPKILIFGVIATFFYLFEFVPKYTGEFKEVNEKFLIAKAKNKQYLEEFKKSYSHTDEYKKYEEVNLEYKKAIEEHKKSVESESFFGFQSLQVFSYELFPLIAILIYCLFNLATSVIRNTSNIGSRLIHFTVLMYVFFKLNWIFKITIDYPKIYYYLFAIISAYLVSLGFILLIKKRYSLMIKLQKAVNVFSTFSLIKAKKYIEEDKEEIYNQELLFDLKKEIE